jgi:hypothetical protein
MTVSAPPIPYIDSGTVAIWAPPGGTPIGNSSGVTIINGGKSDGGNAADFTIGVLRAVVDCYASGLLGTAVTTMGS